MLALLNPKTIAILALVGVIVTMHIIMNGLFGGGGLRSVIVSRDDTISQMQLDQADAIIEAQEIARQEQEDRDAITTASAVAAAEAEVIIETVTRTIIREVEVHVTPEIDDSFGGLPLGFVRIHDAAASGNSSPGTLPIAPGEPDDAASTITVSTLGTLSAGNYGACRANSDKLSRLQSWIREQQAL